MLPILLAAVVLSVAASPPAMAKGATSVTISGPGIEDRSLGYTRRLDDVDVGSLAEVSGIYLIYGAVIASDDPGLTKAELGPRYILTWYQGRTVMAVSHIYPFTTQGAWAHLPYEQSGWVRGDPDLEQALVELGANRPQAGAEAGVSTNSTAVGSGSRTEVEPVEASPSTVSVAGRSWMAGAAVLAVLGYGAWLVRRRRTGTLASWPPHRST